jgi:hypothetical protein
MRPRLSRSRIPLAGAVATLVVLVGVAAAVADGAQSARPARGALTLTSSHPVTVTGTGFKAGTRVRVTLLAGRKLVRRPSTDGRGRFTVTFPAVVDRCSAWTIWASQPGRATVVLHGAKPACAPAGTT